MGDIPDLDEVPPRPRRPLSEVLRDTEQNKCSFRKADGTECGETVKKQKWNWRRHNETVHSLEVVEGAIMIAPFCIANKLQ